MMMRLKKNKGGCGKPRKSRREIFGVPVRPRYVMSLIGAKRLLGAVSN